MTRNTALLAFLLCTIDVVFAQEGEVPCKLPQEVCKSECKTRLVRTNCPRDETCLAQGHKKECDETNEVCVCKRSEGSNPIQEVHYCKLPETVCEEICETISVVDETICGQEETCLALGHEKECDETSDVCVCKSTYGKPVAPGEEVPSGDDMQYQPYPGPVACGNTRPCTEKGFFCSGTKEHLNQNMGMCTIDCNDLAATDVCVNCNGRNSEVCQNEDGPGVCLGDLEGMKCGRGREAPPPPPPTQLPQGGVVESLKKYWYLIAVPTVIAVFAVVIFIF